MTQRSHSFVQPSLGHLSIGLSEIEKKQPLLYTNSSTKLDQFEFETEMIKDKYQKQYNKFYKSLHQRSRSQVEKLERIIQDANDLNEILNDPDKWLLKKAQKQEKKIGIEVLKEGRGTEGCKPKFKWNKGNKIEL